ncbi:MAG: hypothetical protein R3C97_19030 [Geminicoccaceae bacterium]
MTVTARLKRFLTYDRIRLHDEQFLDVLTVARSHGCMVCVHAENHGMIDWMGRRLVERGYTRPVYHAVSHPRLLRRKRSTVRSRSPPLSTNR